MYIIGIIILMTIGLSIYLAHRKLESKDKRKSDLAHDIRSSLSVIKLNSEVTLLNPNLDSELKKVLQGNIVEVEKISKMVDKLRR